MDHLTRPIEPDSTTVTHGSLAPHLGQRISSVVSLVLSLIVPLVTMGLVWPWTGPAASATLAPFLVGIIVQFAFEQYARYTKSRSWSVIPVIFQVGQSWLNADHIFSAYMLALRMGQNINFDPLLYIPVAPFLVSS